MHSDASRLSAYKVSSPLVYKFERIKLVQNMEKRVKKLTGTDLMMSQILDAHVLNILVTQSLE